MTTDLDWRFRAHTLREAANYMRNRAADLLEEARRYEDLANNSDRMAERASLSNGD
jgi:hypothetical protein